MKKWWWIAIIAVIILIAVVAMLILKDKGETGFSFVGEVDYSGGTKALDAVESSTDSNAFKDVELNPFKYENE